MKEPTHAEIRIDFINHCLINPIKEASKNGGEFNLSDTFVGRSLFLILVEKGLVSDHEDDMKPYFDKAESKVVGVDNPIANTPTGKLSLKDMMQQITPTIRTVTEDQREETMLLSYYYIASEWIEKARKEGVNLLEVLKY